MAHTGVREYGRTPVTVGEPGTLLADVPVQHNVWMSHGDSVAAAPEGFPVLASTSGTPVAAFEDVGRGLAGVQWHPEVLHTEHGQKVLEHFLHDIAGCRQTWTMLNIVEEQVEAIRAQIGEGRAICALSGGVDSAVAAAIVQRAIGDRLTCVYVDHGMMRLGETEQVRTDFEAVFDTLDVVDASDQFLGALEGVTTPRRSARSSAASSSGSSRRPRCGSSRTSPSSGDTAYLVQGTLYPDVVESGGGAGTSNIKSHHNVGGLPDDLQFELVEPLRTLFKDEVRLVGEQLGLPSDDGLAPAVPRPGPRHPDHRRGHPRAPRRPPPGRRHRPRGAHPRRPRPRHLADARSCCSPTSARSASRATAAPTATRSSSARSPPRTP